MSSFARRNWGKMQNTPDESYPSRDSNCTFSNLVCPKKIKCVFKPLADFKTNLRVIRLLAYWRIYRRERLPHGVVIARVCKLCLGYKHNTLAGEVAACITKDIYVVLWRNTSHGFQPVLHELYPSVPRGLEYKIIIQNEVYKLKIR
jgi:hypothetical protein